jgi:hypothetical protein
MAIALLAFLVLLTGVAWWVLAPVRAGRASEGAADLAALEAEWDARIAAVRDAESDLQTGKLAPADHQALDAELRRAAFAALRALERARARDDPERRCEP